MKMATTKRRYSKEEFARRGDEIYETKVRPQLKPEDKGKFAAIDIETGVFAIDEDELKACDKLNARIPGAQTWMVRIGSRYVHRFGGREKRAARWGCVGKALAAVCWPMAVSAYSTSMSGK
jgi:hypothetical protein